MRLTWLPEVLAAAHLNVVLHDGWRDRGADLLHVEGVVCHHTATSIAASDAAVVRILANGRSDLAGPLCQLGLARDGTVHVIAAGKGNHNGHGQWGNQSVGLEAFNDGVGEPWPQRQLDAYVAVCAALCRKAGWPASKVLGHKETDPTRKVDPRGIDMNAFRARVDALIPITVTSTPKPLPPLHAATDLMELLMPVFKDDGDAEVLFVRKAYLELLHREPESESTVLFWVDELRAKGADYVWSRVADSDEGRAVRAAHRKLLGLPA